jgi:hypothetical protein
MVVTIIWFMCFSDTVRAQEAVKVVGTIVDSQSQSPVPFVHVYTTTHRKGTISDELGHFELSLRTSDTLIFSSVGYETKIIAFSADGERRLREMKIELHPKTYQLDPVQVTAHPTIEQFKQDVLKLELEEKEKFKLNVPKGARLPPEGPNDVNLNPTIAIGGAIGALYDALSREGKEKRKIEAMRERALDFREVDYRYNVDVVRRVTNLDEERAKRFMEWCKFEDEFILKSSEYEIAVAMLKCLDEFNRADSLR